MVGLLLWLESLLLDIVLYYMQHIVRFLESLPPLALHPRQLINWTRLLLTLDLTKRRTHQGGDQLRQGQTHIRLKWLRSLDLFFPLLARFLIGISIIETSKYSIFALDLPLECRHH